MGNPFLNVSVLQNPRGLVPAGRHGHEAEEMKIIVHDDDDEEAEEQQLLTP